jgi:hypothetical protein
LPGLFGHTGTIVQLFGKATQEEARELVELYLMWEKQNNEAVTPVS